MKTRKCIPLEGSHRLAWLTFVVCAHLNCSLFTGVAPAMSMCRAPFHKSGILPTVWERPVWRTLAGVPRATGTNDGPGISARFSRLTGIAVDASGTIYLADTGNGSIRRITSAGIVSTAAGKPGQLGWQDGPATNALFTTPGALALAADGSLYIADNGVIRRLSAAGLVTTIAGQPNVSGHKDGIGTNALFSLSISGLALDPSGALFVADSDNCVVRKVSLAGEVSTLAGQPGCSGYRDGMGTNALFARYWMGGLTLDTNGNLYVADQGVLSVLGAGPGVIRRISPSGQVSTWVGQPGQWGYLDGQGTNAWFCGLAGLAIDSQGNLYVTESQNRCVRKISPEGMVSTLGGDAWSMPNHCDGRGPFAKFSSPAAIALDPSGHLLISDGSTVRYGSLVVEPQPRILSQPHGMTVQEGTNVTFSVAAQGAAAISYQWLARGGPLTGATNASLLLEGVQEADAGEYQVAVSDGVGYVLSFPASLRVQPIAGTHSQPLDSWHALATLSVRDIHGLAHGNGRYVAIEKRYEEPLPSIGLGGAVATSTDGEIWIRQLPITPQMLSGVAFGDGVFVAVGTAGTVLTSKDGLKWEEQRLTAEGTPDLSGIVFEQGLFAAVSGAGSGSIWTSRDGRNWTNRGIDFGVSLTAVAAEGGKFIAVGNTILVSTNGLDWERAEVPTSYLGREIALEHIACANGTFLASDHCGWVMAVSVDALNWLDVTPTNGLSLCRVVGLNGRFVALDRNSGGISFSTDGTSWTAPAVIASGGRTADEPHLCSADGLLLASGNEGALFTSADGISWMLHQQRAAIPFASTEVLSVEGRYLAVGGQGNPGVAVSTNGSDWDLLLPSSQCCFNCLAYGGSAWVAAGNGEQIFSSHDSGLSWVERSPHRSYGTKYPNLLRMAFGGGVFVSVGNLYDTLGVPQGHILSSANLVDWIATDFAPTSSLSDVAYAPGLFVTLLNRPGDRADILTSTNGFSWQTAASFPSNWFYTVEYGDGRFVIGASTGGVVVSVNGITWTWHAVPGVDYFHTIAFGNGLFLATGPSRTTGSESLWSSPDGVTWIQCSAPDSIGTIAAGEGVFLALGGNGSILYQSGPIERLGNPRWLSNMDLEWTITGAPHLDYRIEVSEDLLSWQTLTRVTNAPARSSFIDSDASTHPGRFYRLATE
jgi:hypothetical protein